MMLWTYLLCFLPLSLEKTNGAAPPSAPGVRAAKAAAEPLFAGLGNHGRRITTRSPQTQRYFNQGLSFLYAFNHDEAVRSFTQATKFDGQCAMAWWGIAIARGPHINNPFVSEANAQTAWEALTQAKAHASAASPVEQALIRAASARYAFPQPADRKPLDAAYAEQMRQVWQQYPDDADVGALFAESMMDLRPWDLWMNDGKPQPGTPEIVTTLEQVLEKNPKHPLGLHLYIHAVEASPDPGKADAAADRLRNLQPGLGHMVHMPSHIDVRRGRWKEAEIANKRAIVADRNYRRIRPRQGFYRVYMLHNQDMLAYAAIMRGKSKEAIEAMDAMLAGVPSEWAHENASIIDGFMAMPMEVRVRFGKWDEVLAMPQPHVDFPISRAMYRACRGIAYAAKGKVEEARKEQTLFEQAAEKVGKDAAFGNNAAADLLGVARKMLAGEISFRAGEIDKGLSELREAVALEDQLRYDEPPDWILPVRHALGAALLKCERYADAIEVYQADLARLPNNGWSLYGLAVSLEKQGQAKQAAEVRKQFVRAWEEADIKISSSCLCLPAS
jgi:tetratricopeptide (TPR) repeat protein